MRRARRLSRSVALALGTLALGVPAPSGGALPPAALAPGALPSAGCSWFGETDQRDVNIGAPDLDAFYWMSPLTPSAGARVVIGGSYPRARYFSFHVYDNQGNALGSIYDQQIAPDRGSANPFRGRVWRGRGDRYTAYVSFGPRPSRAAPNTVYVSPTAAGNAALLVYRVYVPAHTDVPSGDVPFPTVSQQTGTGQSLTSLGPCATTPPPFGSVFWQAAASADYPAAAPVPDNAGATPVPTWQRSFGNQLGNQQNAYLVTTLSHQYGDLVVLHARAPTFPNSRQGRPVYARHQLRYWSLCTYDPSGQAGFGCAADYGATIHGGSITYVVSDPGARPGNATPAHGVTWLPWGAQPAVQLVYRNMLPAPWFSHAVQRVKPSSSVPAVLGAYYPRAVYCRPATFARGGWRACFAAVRR